jgi:hypothetical protein
MSWECPYYNDKICQLNGLKCKPGKGKCVLKGRFEVTSVNRTPVSDKTSKPEKD